MHEQPARSAGTRSYYALRVRDRADAREWWASAERAAAFAPPPIRAILRGRSRVEVSADEAREALAWARSLDGWDSGAVVPLWIYPA